MLRKLQEEQKPWVKHNFGDRPSWMPLLGVMEELGELAHSHLKKAQGIRTTEDHDAKAADAVADIVIFLADYCSAVGIDLESVVSDTWAEVKQRDWKADPARGDNPIPRRQRILTVHSPLIPRAARDLGVTRQHLWYVLSGRRQSRSLSARYDAWCAHHLGHHPEQTPTPERTAQCKQTRSQKARPSSR